jgi:hypothetical protein
MILLHMWTGCGRQQQYRHHDWSFEPGTWPLLVALAATGCTGMHQLLNE